MPIATDETATIETINAPAQIIGTQVSLGFQVQQPKDAGRNTTTYAMTIPVVAPAVEALVSLTGFKGGVAVTATTTPAVVTTGKRYRITSIAFTYVAIATAGTAKFTLRVNPVGVAALTSAACLVLIVGAEAVVAGVAETTNFSIPDGLEFAAGSGIAVSMVGLSATQVATTVGYGQITLFGYEY